MAPAWEELAEKKSKEYAGRVNFAAVNCVANGDLCSENEVLAYPVLQWSLPSLLVVTGLIGRWVDGKKVDMYPPRDDRDFESMAKYVDNLLSPDADAEATPSSSKPKSPTATGPVPNPSGTVVQLTSETFTQHISLVPSKNTGAGWFVKFYVPWCSHCQHMAEAWTELARDMKGKLNIAEVNCDVEGRLCKDVKLRGYPTLIFFKGGERVEYDGLRGLGDLVSFAGKAVQYPPF
jgi:protein disulfide-isomerase